MAERGGRGERDGYDAGSERGDEGEQEGEEDQLLFGEVIHDLGIITWIFE